MKEIITSIKEFFENKGKLTGYEGYKIETTKQTIHIVIDNAQDCCEEWGYLSSVDDFSDFIGAELLGINRVDTDLQVIEVPDLDCGAAIFINVETSKGTLQFAVYNSHNGYYGHFVTVKSDQLNIDAIL